MNSLLVINETYTNGYISKVLVIISFLAILSSIFVIINKNPIVSVLFLIGLFACISSYLIMLGLTFIGLAYLIVYIGAVSILFLFILMLINIRISELQSNTSNSIPLSIIIIISFYYIIFQLLPYSIARLNWELASVNFSPFLLRWGKLSRGIVNEVSERGNWATLSEFSQIFNGSSSNIYNFKLQLFSPASTGENFLYNNYIYNKNNFRPNLDLSNNDLANNTYVEHYFDSSSDLFNAKVSTASQPSSTYSDLFYVTSKIWDGNLAENNHITSIGNIMYTNYNIWLIIASYILLLAMVGAIVITIKPKNTAYA